GDLEDFDILSSDFPAIPDEQTAFSEAVDERPCLCRDLCSRCNASNELASRIDPGQMRNESHARQRKLSLRIFGQFAFGDAFRKRLANRRRDHALEAAELLVICEIELVVGRVILVEMRQSEGE